MNENLTTMKVLMLLDNPMVSDNRVDKEGSTLAKEGFEVEIACTKSESLLAIEFRNGYKINRCIEEGFDAPLRKGYKRYIQETSDLIASFDFDVLHCHDFYMLSIGCEVKKKNQKTILIYDSHEYLKGWPFYKTLNNINRLKGKLVWYELIKKERRESRQADKIISVNDRIADLIKQNYQINNITVINNYPEFVNIEPDKTYYHRKFGLHSDSLILVHSGNIYLDDEQLIILAESIKILGNIKVIFLGNKPRFLEVKELFEKNFNFDDTIYFHDYPNDQKKLIQLLGSAHIGFLYVREKWLSHKYTTPNRLLEYLAAGLPVVSCEQEVARKVNEIYPCISFYRKFTMDELQITFEEALMNLSENTKTASTVFSELNWEKESMKLLQLYNGLND